jgi:hypothetical protein
LPVFFPLQRWPFNPRAAANSGASKKYCASVLRRIQKPSASALHAAAHSAALQRVPIPDNVQIFIISHQRLNPVDEADDPKKNH